MGKTGIEWTDETWNPTIGCSRVSPGCLHCYAEVQAERIVRMARARGKSTPYADVVKLVGGEPRWTGVVPFMPDRLALPLRWREPRRVFVNSMSDLFHERLLNAEIAAVFAVMAACPQHTFQILTKRADRMRAWFKWVVSTGYAPGHVLSTALGDVAAREHGLDGRFEDDEWLVGLTNVINGRSSWSHHDDGNPLDGSRPRWPLPNVVIGVSVEDRRYGVPRIDELRDIPAAVRMLSIEPLLEDLGTLDLRGIGWAIAGCESGDDARQIDASAFRSIRDQCKAAGVPFFLKQAREGGGITVGPDSHRKPGGIIGAPLLDGEALQAFPEVGRG